MAEVLKERNQSKTQNRLKNKRIGLSIPEIPGARDLLGKALNEQLFCMVFLLETDNSADFLIR